MLSEDTKTLEFNQYRKSDKTSFIVYADLKSLIEKIDGCKNNEHILSGFSKSALLALKHIENNHSVYRGKYCMKIFCESLREHAMKIINF